jgi:Ni,Fe-hydrogenase maturation factor
MLLALAKSLYGRAPRALSISIRGHDFDFGTEMSTETAKLADKAVQVLWDIIRAPRSQAPQATNGLSCYILH